MTTIPKVAYTGRPWSTNTDILSAKCIKQIIIIDTIWGILQRMSQDVAHFNTMIAW